MTVAFDFHTLSLTIDHALDEYLQLRGRNGEPKLVSLKELRRHAGIAPPEPSAGPEPPDMVPAADVLDAVMGINLAEAPVGDRSKFLRFRHEHAHFTSFVASGLADLYGVFSDYILVFLSLALVGQAADPSKIELEVPLIAGADADKLSPQTRDVINRAWRQINHARAFFFGFGTTLSLGELLDLQTQDQFWKIHFQPRFTPIVQRYYGLMSGLLPARPGGADLTRQSALPPVVVNEKRRVLTTRAVMEAYAITIELFHTHFRKLETNLTFYGSPTVRDPGPLYTIAIEYALENSGASPTATLGEFLQGEAPLELYYLIAALSFAAMQVPVIQMLNGNVVVAGNLQTLCPAYRFRNMVDALKQNRIPPLPANVRSEESGAALLSWLWSCHEAIGDHDTKPIYEHVNEQFDSDPALRAMSREKQTLVQLSWAARANFCRSPNEYVLDAGLFSERYPCQPRFIRTSDGRLAANADSMDRFATRHLTEHALPMLEAAVFAEHWDSAWAKMPEIAATARARQLELALLWCNAGFSFADFDAAKPPAYPKITLRF